MKKYISLFKILCVVLASFFIVGCVHDDKYDVPNLDGGQCADMAATMTIAQLKAKFANNTTYVFPDNATDILEGYVSSSDESGNIYKTIYIQDDPTNPTQGLTISVDAVSTYTKYPQGSKVYIKLNGLAIGKYNASSPVQLSKMVNGSFDRIPEADLATHIFKSCTVRKAITPKVMTLADMKTANDQYIGVLVQVNDAEFDAKALCSTYAPDGVTVDRQINDPTTSVTTRIVRNSGYASFANQILPSGKGKFIGILSKYGSAYQLMINSAADLADMNHFPRKDGITADPCSFNPAGTTALTVAQVKQLFTSGNMNQINNTGYLKAKVTANDETGNFYKSIYVEDATGGIKVGINKTSLFQDARFAVGKEVIIKLSGLYIGQYGGELQLGQPNGNTIGQIAEADVYKYFFDSNAKAVKPVPTEKTISQLSAADVGRWIKIKDLQLVDGDLGKNFASGSTTNRTLTDCSGNTILLRTSSQATFAGATIDSGKGDVYAILSVFNGTYQLWIPYLWCASLQNPRCDGTLPQVTQIFTDGFDSGLTNWSAVNVTGTQVWGTTTYGNPKPSAFIDGGRATNEDWLISKPIAVPAGQSDVLLSLETDGRFTGNPLEVYVTENYTTPTGTSWTKLSANMDTDMTNYSGFVSSGSLSIKQFAGKNLVIGIKYTSAAGNSTSWELDNVRVIGVK